LSRRVIYFLAVLARKYVKKIIIVPAFNEEANIGSVLASVKESCPDFDVLVINDGSTDKTLNIARSFAFARTIDLPINLGIGGAVQTGFLHSRRHGYGLAVQIDGDGQHKPSEVPKITAPILRDEADVVIGSRFMEKGSYRKTMFRRAGIKLFSWTNRILLGERITDSTSGFRSYNKKAIAILSEDYPDDYPEPEAVFILKRKGLRIKEVPVEMATRAGGKSSISVLESIYYMIKVFLAIFVLMLRKQE
jgi:glycosyltransferase involved in cell wall biosynthesis